MTTYTTLDNEVLDLSNLTEARRAFFDRCYALWAARAPWEDLVALVVSAENPALEPGRRITRAVLDDPLYRAVRDLENRLGIIHKKLGPEPGDEPERDPLEDSWVTVAEAATRKGVTKVAVRKAISRGDLIAGGAPLKVSVRTLDRWEVADQKRR